MIITTIAYGIILAGGIATLIKLRGIDRMHKKLDAALRSWNTEL